MTTGSLPVCKHTVLGPCGTPRFRVPADPFWVYWHTSKRKTELSRKGKNSHTSCHYAGLQALPHRQLTPRTVNHAEHTKLYPCSIPLHHRKFRFLLHQVTNSFLYRLVTLHRLQTPNQRWLLYKTLPHRGKPLWRGQSINLQWDGKKQTAYTSQTLENPIS